MSVSKWLLAPIGKQMLMKKALKLPRIALLGILFAISAFVPGYAQTQSQRRPALIRDTDVADQKEVEETKAEEPKEYNPELASQNLKVGNFYYKQKNYDAAIQRYLEAIGFQPGLADAYEALAQAYERNGSLSKAIQALREFIQKNPESPKVPEFREQAERLEKKLPPPLKN
jgi:tetratricopeptide (TPR) repeat protein